MEGRREEGRKEWREGGMSEEMGVMEERNTGTKEERDGGMRKEGV